MVGFKKIALFINGIHRFKTNEKEWKKQVDLAMARSKLSSTPLLFFPP
jgi:hypothetical protein